MIGLSDDAFMRFAQQRAAEAEALSVEDRDDFYSCILLAGIRVGLRQGQTPEVACLFAEQAVALTRALVGPEVPSDA
jgi:CO dehydrogenase/acetyl-CoA synthase beta subunit